MLNPVMAMVVRTESFMRIRSRLRRFTHIQRKEENLRKWLPQSVDKTRGTQNVGLQGFEPWTSCTRGRRSTKLSHSPNLVPHRHRHSDHGRHSVPTSRTSIALASDTIAAEK